MIYSPIIPIIIVFRENKNKIKTIVNENPSYGLKKYLFIRINIKNKKIIPKDNNPNLVIRFAGPAVDDNIASNPYLIKKIY